MLIIFSGTPKDYSCCLQNIVTKTFWWADIHVDGEEAVIDKKEHHKDYVGELKKRAEMYV